MSGTSKAIPSGALKLTARVLMEMENLPVGTRRVAGRQSQDPPRTGSNLWWFHESVYEQWI